MPPFLTPLNTDALRQVGVPAPWCFGMADRVRFSELDALNHVNHTAYLRWFESLRLLYCRDYGISDYSETAPQLVLKAVGAQYHAPMFLSEDYIATARTVRFRTTSFEMDYAVFAPDLRVVGTALVVLLTSDGRGRFPLTEAMKSAFMQRDGATAET